MPFFNGLLIESYVLQDEIADVDAARNVLFSLPKSSEWVSKSKNTEWSETPGSSSSLVSCFLPACGIKNSGSGIADTSVGTRGYYWSSAPSGSKAFSWDFSSSRMLEAFYNKTVGLSVRLFHE